MWGRCGPAVVPCLLVREDLKAVLIESKEKKARFLKTAVETLGLQSRAIVANRQFEEVDPSDCQFVTCRALDKFTEKLPRLVKWSRLPHDVVIWRQQPWRNSSKAEIKCYV